MHSLLLYFLMALGAQSPFTENAFLPLWLRHWISLFAWLSW